MADLKVSLPNPCGEQWEAMAPQGCNRLCSSCDTIIHDLTSMTVDEAEALLDNNEEICVRARIAPDGNVRTADSAFPKSRRIIAAVGASLSLATAACQTTAPLSVSPRYEISGQLKQYSWAGSARLQSDTGKAYKRTIWGDGKFRFSNLRPGKYTLSLIGTCEEVYRFDDIIVDKDIILNEIETNDRNDCIIIGVMQRTDEPRRG
jgi:hypothetical protein